MPRDIPDTDMSKELTLEPVERFRFACYPTISCFNECCKNLNLALTPYDVLRMSRGLGLTTDKFLERYTTWHVGIATGLPVVVLKMLSDGNCPLVTESGCSIYNHRPTPCRLYPLVRVRAGEEVQYYLLREDFCLGHLESKSWSLEEWVDDQELLEYNHMNDLFFELIAVKNRTGKNLTDREINAIYRACFDIDGFKSNTGIEDDIEALRKGIMFSIRLILGRETNTKVVTRQSDP